MTDQPVPDTVEAVRADIERTRAELADAVDQLTRRLDVKARARSEFDAHRNAVVGGAAALVGSLVAIALIRRHRR